MQNAFAARLTLFIHSHRSRFTSFAQRVSIILLDNWLCMHIAEPTDRVSKEIKHSRTSGLYKKYFRHGRHNILKTAYVPKQFILK